MAKIISRLNLTDKSLLMIQRKLLDMPGLTIMRKMTVPELEVIREQARDLRIQANKQAPSTAREDLIYNINLYMSGVRTVIDELNMKAWRKRMADASEGGKKYRGK